MNAPIKPLACIITDDDKAKFWGKVRIGEADECWPWMRATTRAGYGCIRRRGEFLYAHRIAYFLDNGEPPTDKPIVCHTCDNPGCCNPAHLFAGSTKDNSVDMVSKERSAAGERHGLRKHPERVSRGKNHYAKTNPEKLARGCRHGSRSHPEKVPMGIKHWGAKHEERDIYEIRSLFAQGFSQGAIARKFNVAQSNISKIVRRKLWAHLPDIPPNSNRPAI